MPTEKYLENLVYKQLCCSKQLEQPMGLYNQDIAHKGIPRSYQRLVDMAYIHIEDKWAAKMPIHSESSSQCDPGAKSSAKGAAKAGVCVSLAKHGFRSGGDDCCWQSTHTKSSERRGRSKSRGREDNKEKKGGSSRERSKSPSYP